MIEKMKSVCGSGRKNSFCRPLPMPSPRSPPVPIAISDCMAWNPFPSGSASGFMNVNSRSRRYAALKTSSTPAGMIISAKVTTRIHETPAAKIIPAATRTSVVAVPKSGSSKTSPANSAMTNARGSSVDVSSLIRSSFRARYEARKRISAGLANSLGCSWKCEKTIQRCVPLIGDWKSAMTSATSTAPTTA